MTHPLHPDLDDDALLTLWDRIGITVRCGYHPFCACPLRMYLQYTCRVALRGLRSEAQAQCRALQVLLQTVRDEALPRRWRELCLQHTQLPLIRLGDLLGRSDPLALQALQAATQHARDLLYASTSDSDLTPPQPMA